VSQSPTHRRGLEGTLSPYRETVKVALVHLGTTALPERIVAMAAETEEHIAVMAADEAMTRHALELLGSQRNDAYEAALAALRENTQAWWADGLAAIWTNSERTSGRPRMRGAAPVRKPQEGTG
jgi:hypothetical protein